MKPLTQFVVVMAVVVLAGCAGTRTHETSSSVVEFLYPKGAPASVREGPVTFTLPATVGIAFVPANTKGARHAATYRLGGGLSETEQFRLLQKVAAHFKKYKFIKSIQIIPQTYLMPDGGWANLSAVAKMFGVDVIALVSYDQVQTTSEDALSLAYLTIVGAYFIPGEKNMSSTFVDTTVFDAASHKLLFRAPGMSRIHGRSTPIGHSGAVERQSHVGYEKAVDKMIVNLDTALKQFQATVKNQPKNYKVTYRNPDQYSGGGGMGIMTLLFFLVIAGEALYARSCRKRAIA